MVDFIMKQGDTLPILEFQCQDANGPVAIDTAIDVRLHVTRGVTIVVNESCIVLDDGVTPNLKGKGEYHWRVADTDTELGLYDFEVEVDYGGDNILTFPNGKINPKLLITKQLA